MCDYAAALDSIRRDPRYQRNLAWGRPRKGHPEGTIAAHIAELERNLEQLRPKLSDEEAAKLRLLIHVHDTFKPDAVDGVAIRDPRGHASLARAFLAEFCGDDSELLEMVQWHDEAYALFLKARGRALPDEKRWDALKRAIGNWDVFLAFLLIDGSTKGKSREPLTWTIVQLQRDGISTRFGFDDVAALAG